MVPERASSVPTIASAREVLPDPTLPTTITRSPRRAVREMSVRTVAGVAALVPRMPTVDSSSPAATAAAALPSHEKEALLIASTAFFVATSAVAYCSPGAVSSRSRKASTRLTALTAIITMPTMTGKKAMGVLRIVKRLRLTKAVETSMPPWMTT